MSIKDLLNRLDDFFDQSRKKQAKKADKLVKIICLLEEKKADLKQEIKLEAKSANRRKKIYSLCKEFKVVSKMIKKAKKQQHCLSQ